MGSHQIKCSKGALPRQQSKAIGRVDGLVTSDEIVHNLMLNREAWRSRIKMIVAVNKEVDVVVVVVGEDGMQCVLEENNGL
jgi:hypothetical protein